MLPILAIPSHHADNGGSNKVEPRSRVEARGERPIVPSCLRGNAKSEFVVGASASSRITLSPGCRTNASLILQDQKAILHSRGQSGLS